MTVAGRLEGKTVVVAGAGQSPGETFGNGRAIALLFGQAGADVLCVDRLQERAEATAAEIVAAGGSASAMRADITIAADCAAVLDAALARGPLDILVNNVGIGGGGDGPAHKLTEATFDRILAVNLKGMWRMTAAVLPGMRERRSGSIVNVSSLASIAGGFQLAYELSKAGVNRLTTSVAASNASRGVRCNAVSPGLMDTEMAVAGIATAESRDIAEVRAERSARVPIGRMGTAWDTAHAVLFLASDEAQFITGVILPVDGGASTRIG